jgi:hypothetical protein
MSTPETKIPRIRLRHTRPLDVIRHILLGRSCVHIQRVRVPQPNLVGLERNDGLVHDETHVRPRVVAVAVALQARHSIVKCSDCGTMLPVLDYGK